MELVGWVEQRGCVGEEEDRGPEDDGHAGYVDRDVGWVVVESAVLVVWVSGVGGGARAGRTKRSCFSRFNAILFGGRPSAVHARMDEGASVEDGGTGLPEEGGCELGLRRA